MWILRPGPLPGATLWSEGGDTVGAMLSGLCCYQGSMVPSGTGLLANGHVCVHSLPHPVSMLIFMALVTIEGCVTVQAVGLHLDPCQSPGTTLLLDHADLSDPC